MTKQLFLAYLREPELQFNASVFSGHFESDGVEGGVFLQRGYTDMIRLFSAWANGVHDARLFIKRLESNHIWELDQLQSELLRRDVEEYIRQTSPDPIFIGRDRAVEAPINQRSLSAGHETLADAFGDKVYVRVRGNKLECPGCGRWSAEISTHTSPLGPDITQFCDAVGCHFMGSGRLTDSWLAISTVELLCWRNRMDKRFYLPRAWNKPGPWISREDLQAKYDKYLQEKDQCPHIRSVH